MTLLVQVTSSPRVQRHGGPGGGRMLADVKVLATSLADRCKTSDGGVASMWVCFTALALTPGHHPFHLLDPSENQYLYASCEKTREN